MLIVDGHEDLAYNALVDGRNYLESAHAIRAAEAGGAGEENNGICMLGLPEWLRGDVAVVIATLLTIPRTHAHVGEPGYPNPESAHQLAFAQLNIYRQWAANHPQVRLLTHREHLDDLVQSWSGPPEARQVGLVLLMENADPIRDPAEVAFWYEQGLRLIGPAWHGNRYTGSNLDPGPLTAAGRELLREMDRVGMILDLSHMADEAAREAVEIFRGPIVATHANPRRMVEMERLLPDWLIREIGWRDGMIGVMPVNWALDPTWPDHRTKAAVHLDRVVDAIDIVCQLTGDTQHVGIGTDFDGGQGAECAPAELDTIADLPKLADVLGARGYQPANTEAIMGDNWLRFLRAHLPRIEAK